MKTRIGFVALFSVLAIVSCKKDEEEKNPFVGQWELKSDQSSVVDTALIITVNEQNEFDHQVNGGGVNANLKGSILENGDVNGTIKAFGLQIGSIDGHLLETGIGNGNYYIGSDTLGWVGRRL